MVRESPVGVEDFRRHCFFFFCPDCSFFGPSSLIARCCSFILFFFGVAELGWLLSVRMMWLYPFVHILRRVVLFFIIYKIQIVSHGCICSSIFAWVNGRTEILILLFLNFLAVVFFLLLFIHSCGSSLTSFIFLHARRELLVDLILGRSNGSAQ